MTTTLRAHARGLADGRVAVDVHPADVRRVRRQRPDHHGHARRRSRTPLRVRRLAGRADPQACGRRRPPGDRGGWPVRVTLLPKREKIAAPLARCARPPVRRHRRLHRRHAALPGPLWSSIWRATGRADRRLQHAVHRPRASSVTGRLPGSDSAIWGRSGAVIDPATGEMLVATGNGPFDGRRTGATPCSSSARTRPVPPAPTRPPTRPSSNASDLDLGSTAPALVSDRGPSWPRAERMVSCWSWRSAAAASAGWAGSCRRCARPAGRRSSQRSPSHRAGGRHPRLRRRRRGHGAPIGCRAPAARPAVPAWSNATAGTSPVLAGGLLLRLRPGRGAQRLPAADRRPPGASAGRTRPLELADRRRRRRRAACRRRNRHATSGEIDLYSRRLPE